MQRKHPRPLCGQRKGVLCLRELSLSHSVVGWEQFKGRVTLAQTQCRIQSTGRGAWSTFLSGVGGCGAHARGYHSDCAAATALDENCPHQRKLDQPSVDFSGYWDETGCPSLLYQHTWEGENDHIYSSQDVLLSLVFQLVFYSYLAGKSGFSVYILSLRKIITFRTSIRTRKLVFNYIKLSCFVVDLNLPQVLEAGARNGTSP